MKNDKTRSPNKTTTVRVITSVYGEFKQKSYESGFNLQKLVNRAMMLYNTDAEFRNGINESENNHGKIF